MGEATERLVGESPKVTVKMGGHPISCLLDTGSQVSMIRESPFQAWFGQKGVKLQDPSSWLTLTAANGQDIPYLGCVELDITIGSVTLRKCGIIVVKDHCLPSTPALLGMNIIRSCWKTLFQEGETKGGTTMPLETSPAGQKAWKHALRVCSQEARFTQPGGEVGYIRTTTNVKILPRQEVLLTGRVRGGPGGRPYLALVESMLEETPWLLARAVVKAEGGQIPIRIKNPGKTPVYLRRYQRVGRLSLVQPGNVFTGNINLSLSSPDTIEVDLQPTSLLDPAAVAPIPVDLSGADLSADEQRQVAECLARHKAVFSQNDQDYGRATTVLHEIPTGDAPPIRERHRQIPPNLYQEVRALLQDMLEAGVIHQSCSPWAAPIVLVRKTDGSLRFCVDYRKINKVTRRDAFPLPRIEESLTMLSKAKYFSTLDLASGYWQVPVHPDDRQKTAFTTPMGLFEFDRMPMGLCNAPATFQRLMESCLGDKNFESLLIYLDDLIVFAPDFSTHLLYLEQVFQRLSQYGLKLKPSKCHLFQPKVKYLGHVVTEAGVTPVADKVRAVSEWPQPKTVRELRAFLGLVGYYRRFIKDFAKVAMPLHGLLVGHPKKESRKVSAALTGWTPECEAAFGGLKRALTEAPILAFADFSLPFAVYTDASNRGLGAVLAQTQDGVERVIAYASRSLHPSEKNDANYSSFKLEFLALKWAVSEKFHEYLLGSQFVVFTDNNTLANLQGVHLGSLEQRWAARLANYHFEILFRPGRSNGNADALSRVPVKESEDGGEDSADLAPVPRVSARVVNAFLAGVGNPGPKMFQSPVEVHLGEVQLGRTPEEWRKAQERDDAIRAVLLSLRTTRAPNTADRTTLRVWRERRRLSLREGVLYRCVRDPSTANPTLQLVLPAALKEEVWQNCHDRAGHTGVGKTVALIRSRFFWPNLTAEAEERCASCPRCVLRKAPAVTTQAPLVSITTTRPMELVAMDFLKLPLSTDGHQYVLVVTDHFTKYAWAIPTRDQSAHTTATALWKHVIRHVGSPQRFHSDQGANFESAVIQELCGLYGTKKSRTTPYHPEGNGVCERFNRSLLSLLGTLEEGQKPRWPEYIAELMFMYNNTVHSATGQTPAYLLLGWHPRLPLDVTLGVPSEQPLPQTDWVRTHHQKLTFAHQRAAEKLETARQQQKRAHDQCPLSNPLLPGERVLLKQRGAKVGGKLADYWERIPHVVVSQPNTDLPVYVVKPEMGEGGEKVLHRNLMRQCPVAYTPKNDVTVTNQPESQQVGPLWGLVSLPFPGTARPPAGPAGPPAQVTEAPHRPDHPGAASCPIQTLKT